MGALRLWVSLAISVALIASSSMASASKSGLRGQLEKLLGVKPSPTGPAPSNLTEDFEYIINEQFKNQIENRKLKFQAVYTGMATEFKRHDRVEGYFNIILCDISGNPCYQRFVIPIEQRNRIGGLKRGKVVSVEGRLMNRFLGSTTQGTMGHDWKAPFGRYHGVHIIEVDKIY